MDSFGETEPSENCERGGERCPFEYTIDTKGNSGTVLVTVTFAGGEIGGTVTATANVGPGAAAAAQPGPAPTATPAPAEALRQPIQRGCLACHSLANPSTGQFTLAFEAATRTAARGPGRVHPTVAPDGTSTKVTDVNNVDTCLLCHGPASARDIGGVAAPLDLRSIVHPAHMFSSIFAEEFAGNCFSCHEVTGDGTFMIINQKLDVNDKGVPNVTSIPGLIAPPSVP